MYNLQVEVLSGIKGTIRKVASKYKPVVTAWLAKRSKNCLSGVSGTADFTLSENKTFFEAGCTWLDVVLANTAEGVRRLSYNAGRFEGD